MSLPIEHEIERGDLYRCDTHNVVRRGVDVFSLGHYHDDCKWTRMGDVAVYAPEPVEPTGLGAVIKDGHGHLWVRTDGVHPFISPWLSSGWPWRSWADMYSPITVLSAGWSE